jgi:hypothetical protein
LVTTHISTVHEAVGAGDQICVYFIEIPNTLPYSVLDVDRVNNSIPSALSDHSPESEDIAFDTTLESTVSRRILMKVIAVTQPTSFDSLLPEAMFINSVNYGSESYAHRTESYANRTESYSIGLGQS